MKDNSIRWIRFPRTPTFRLMSGVMLALTVTLPVSAWAQSGKLADPFANEKPTLTISVANMTQYADKLTAGTKELMKKYPDYKILIYPTHNNAKFPANWVANTARCASTAKTTDEGNVVTGARNCMPFPEPKNGAEAIWNHLYRFRGRQVTIRSSAYNVNSAGKSVLSSGLEYRTHYLYQDDASKDNKMYSYLLLSYTEPARRAGEKILFHEPMDYLHVGRKAWQYLPGQRRVRLAPTLAYDTPNPSTAGASTWDDVYLLNGAIDRYSWKLIGKQDMYVPYNDYKFVFHTPASEGLGPKFLKPEAIRYELHNVYVVEATLRPGKRHIYAKRRFYIDADSGYALASDSYDARGQYFRAGFAFPVQNDKVPAFFADTYVHYDLIAGSYSINLWLNGPKNGVWYDKTYPDDTFTPAALAGSGVR